MKSFNKGTRAISVPTYDGLVRTQHPYPRMRQLSGRNTHAPGNNRRDTVPVSLSECKKALAFTFPTGSNLRPKPLKSIQIIAKPTQRQNQPHWMCRTRAPCPYGGRLYRAGARVPACTAGRWHSPFSVGSNLQPEPAMVL